MLFYPCQFNGKRKDTQRDRKFHQPDRVIKIAERNKRQCDAVPNSKRGNGPKQATSTTHQQEQAKDEHQMIKTRPDVLHTQAGIVPRNVASSRLSRHYKLWPFRIEHLLVLTSVKQAHHDHCRCLTST